MNKKIIVIGGFEYVRLMRRLSNAVFDVNLLYKNPREVGLVLFSGGADIHPGVYGETSPKGLCMTNRRRDEFEIEVFRIAVSHGIPMAGICRGFQLLSVLAGGRLMHDIEGHQLFRDGHAVITSTRHGDIVTNSIHHQMVIPHENCRVFAIAKPRRSFMYYGDEDKVENYDGPEVEGAYFDKIKAFGVQWHPELYGDFSNTELFLEMTDQLMRNKKLDVEEIRYGGNGIGNNSVVSAS